MKHHDEPTLSKAAIAGHPLHPMLVSFPIAFLVGALLTDIAFLTTSDAFWARASTWLIGAGLVAGLFAAVFGLIDFLTRPSIRQHTIAWWHMGFNVAAMALTAINLYVRLRNSQQAITSLEIALSVIVSGMLAISGWLGGEMSFKHKIGVVPDQGDITEELEMDLYQASTAGD